MTTPNEQSILVTTLNIALSGNWEEDKFIIEKVASQPTAAHKYYEHATAIKGLFDLLTWGTKAQPKHPERKGLLRKVHDELFPIAHFASLYFKHPNNVIVQWIEGNQHHDAMVEYTGEGSNGSSIRYLEVTTLQDKKDADELKELSHGTIIKMVSSNADQEKHDRKTKQLIKILEKKSNINYPDKTALLVYTDENRFREFSYGAQAPALDKKIAYDAILQNFAPSLRNFSHVFIFSASEIYCTWTNSA